MGISPEEFGIGAAIIAVILSLLIILLVVCCIKVCKCCGAKSNKTQASNEEPRAESPEVDYNTNRAAELRAKFMEEKLQESGMQPDHTPY